MVWRYKIYNGDRLVEENTTSNKPSIEIDSHPNWVIKKDDNGIVTNITYQPPAIHITYEEIQQTGKEDLV